MDVPVSARAALLQALDRGSGYGFDLAARLRESTGGALNLSDGSTYPALRALEANGLVVSAGTEPRGDRGGRPRQLYRITEAGRLEAKRQRGIMLAVMGMGAPAGPAQQSCEPEDAPEPERRRIVVLDAEEPEGRT